MTLLHCCIHLHTLPVSMESIYHVVAIPYPGRGHINPMINLCRLLASKGLLVSFIVTEEWLELLGASTASLLPNFRFCSIPNVIPSERTRGSQLVNFAHAVFMKMETPTEELIERLQPPVDSIITTSFMAWAAQIAKRRNIPVSSLWTESPTVFLAFEQFEQPDADEQLDMKLSGKQKDPVYLPRLTSSFLGENQSSTFYEGIMRQYKKGFSWFRNSHALLFTSFHELDAHVIDRLSSSLSVPVFPIGPSIPYMMLTDEPVTDVGTTNSLRWLDQQPESSVIYVALGSFSQVCSNQMEEIANGLKMSGERFFLIAREETERMQELSGGRGLVVAWCDQLRILSHSSVGGFLTHCGWNSILEGVFCGVPMLTFPLIWDQFPNSKIIVDDWKIGFRLKNEAAPEEMVVAKEDIAKMVGKLMEMESEECKEVRKRAGDLKDRCNKALGEGGSLSRNLDAFVQGLVGKNGLSD